MSIAVKKIFVSGCAGLIGSHIVRRFLDRGVEVIGADNLCGGYVDNVDPRCQFWRIDCGDLETVRRVMGKDVDVVYHTACYPHEGLSPHAPWTVCHSVYDVTLSVLTAAIAQGVRRFVNCSSMSRYGTNVKLPFTEDLLPMPVDPYGASKSHAEKMVELLCGIHGREWTTAIPHNVTGVGARYDDAYRGVCGIMMNRLLQGKPAIIYGSGDQTRCVSFVKDAVDCLEKMAYEDSVVGRVINIGPDDKDGEILTVNQLCARIQRVLGIDIPSVHVDPRPHEVEHAYCSSSLARSLLGYRTTVTLDDGLHEMGEWIKLRGPRPFTYHLPIEIQSESVPKTWTQRMF